MTNECAITIYHNPDCGTSRKVLALIEAAGHVPTVVEYRKAGWTRALLTELLAAMVAKPRDLLREKGTAAAGLGLLAEGVSDESLIQAMLADPLLVNRPIVVTPKGTKLCRPADIVLTLLDRQPDHLRPAPEPAG